jgi:hypothetical protein
MHKDIKLIEQISNEYKQEMIEAFKENFVEVINGREVIREDITVKNVESFFNEWLDITEKDYEPPMVEDYTGASDPVGFAPER